MIWGEEIEGIWYFDCVNTNYQLGFWLDQDGHYYEGWEDNRWIRGNSIEQFFEGFAIREELTLQKGWSKVKTISPIHRNIDTDFSYMGLQYIPEASDETQSWWGSNTLFLHVTKDGVWAWSKTGESAKAFQKLQKSYFVFDQEGGITFLPSQS